MAASRRFWIVLLCIFLFGMIALIALLHWGGYVLVKTEAMPPHADGAIILQASVDSENARILGAVRLLQQGIVTHILLSTPKTGYWGLSFPDLARTYLEKQYGTEIANHFEFCVVGPGVDSTEQEAEALMPCVKARNWNSLIVVTSNFHSRRAAMIWQRTWEHASPSIHLWIDGVPDPGFQPDGWWRNRRYAKTWLGESTKLLWSSFFK